MKRVKLLVELPYELLYTIVTYIRGVDLLKISHISKILYTLTCDEVLWHTYIFNEYCYILQPGSHRLLNRLLEDKHYKKLYQCWLREFIHILPPYQLPYCTFITTHDARLMSVEEKEPILFTLRSIT